MASGIATKTPLTISFSMNRVKKKKNARNRESHTILPRDNQGYNTMWCSSKVQLPDLDLDLRWRSWVFEISSFVIQLLLYLALLGFVKFFKGFVEISES